MSKIIIFLLMLATLFCQAADDAKKSFFASEDLGKGLPPNKIYPRGRLFPFSFYSTGGGSEKKRKLLLPEELRIADQKEIIASGVTMIGPQYELNDSIMEDAGKYKVKAFYTVEVKIDGETVTKKYIRKLHKLNKPLNTQKVRESVRKTIEKVGSNDSISWWNITPEEMRYWRKQEKEYLVTVAKAIHDFDPLKRPVYMYEPGHVGAKRLAISGKYIDIIGKGIYPNYSNQKKSRVFCRWSVEQELEAIKLVGEQNKVPIAVVEMFQQPSDDEVKLIENWARHDVYCSLAAGAKGVLVFSASRRPNFKVRKNYLNAYFKICKELQGELGQAILFGKRKSDLTLDIVSGPKEVKFKYYTFPEKKYSSVSIANIAYNNSRYLILVNSANESVNVIVDGLVYGSQVAVCDVFNKTKFTAPEGQIEVTLAPLEAKVFKISLGK
jgi:hypothetical protein